MKSLLLSAAALMLLLVACTTEPDGGSQAAPDILVRVTDSLTGAPLKADTVYWSYAADPVLAKASHGSDTTKKAAERINPAGTRWGINHEGLHGDVYIRVRYEEVDPGDSLCLLTGTKTVLVNAHTLPLDVTVALKTRKLCQ